MKFLQFINTSLDELWRYQKENNYDGIFLQETNYTDEKKPLDNLNNGEVKCIQYKKVKMQVLGLAHSHQSQQKNVFSNDYINNDFRFME